MLEILVAMALCGLALTLLLQLYSAGLRNIAISEDHAAAAVRTSAKFSEILQEGALAPRTWTETTEDGYRLDISIQETHQEKTESLPVALMEIGIVTRWARGDRVYRYEAKTMKLIKRNLSTPEPI